MRGSLFVAASAGALAFVAAPASATVRGFDNVTLGSTPTVFTLPGATFGFTYDAAAAAAFDPNTYSVQTTGTGATSAFGGFLGIPLEPSLFFTRSNVTIDANLFPSFAAFPDLSAIPDSLTGGDLALRTGTEGNFFFGFARLNGDGTLNFAFESEPNTAITAGTAISGPLAIAPSVPEPATWAMMLLGFGGIGMALRRRKRLSTTPAYALS